MNKYDFSQIDFTQPDIARGLAEAFSVLIRKARSRGLIELKKHLVATCESIGQLDDSKKCNSPGLIESEQMLLLKEEAPPSS